MVISQAPATEDEQAQAAPLPEWLGLAFTAVVAYLAVGGAGSIMNWARASTSMQKGDWLAAGLFGAFAVLEVILLVSTLYASVVTLVKRLDGRTALVAAGRGLFVVLVNLAFYMAWLKITTPAH